MAIKFSNTPARGPEVKTGKGKSSRKEMKSSTDNLEIDFAVTDEKGKSGK